MSDGVHLLGLIRGLSRRLRGRTALAGASIGGAVALGALEAAATLARMTGPGAPAAASAGHLATLAGALVAGALLGAAIGAWRAEPSAAAETDAARLLDRWIADRRGPAEQPRNGDRVRVALDLLGGEHDSRFAKAAIADGWRAAGSVSLAEIAPWGRPPGSVVLGLMLALAVPVHGWTRPDGSAPWRAGARRNGDGKNVPGQTTRAAATRTAGKSAGNLAETSAEPSAETSPGSEGNQSAADLDQARREAGLLAELARTSGDADLLALARRLATALDALSGRVAGTGRAAELTALVAEARAAAAEARLASVRALPEAKPGSAPERRSRPGADDAPAAQTGAGASAPETTRSRRLDGLDQGAEGRAPGDDQAPGRTPPATEEERARQLRRLARELDQERGTGAQPGRPAAGTAGPSSGGGGGGAVQGGRAPGEARERLARAEERVRRALGEGGAAAGRRSSRPTAPDPTSMALAEFERRARGNGSGGPGMPPRQGADGEAAGGGGDEAGSSSGGGVAGAGRRGGPNDQGRRAGEAGQTGEGQQQGPQLEAQVAEGPGPSRAQSIALGAGLGFADRAYDRTYRAYRAAVDETLDLAAVPEGRQQLVRRYFELIRPRTR